MKNDESNLLLYGRRGGGRGGTEVLVYLVGKYGRYGRIRFPQYGY
jgi:hypothetical protein